MAMKRGRFSEEQIVGIPKEHEAGRKIAELSREHGISEATLYGWKSKYGGMEVGEAQRLRSLEDENRRLKQLVADLSLDKEALKAIVRDTYCQGIITGIFAFCSFAQEVGRTRPNKSMILTPEWRCICPGLSRACGLTRTVKTLLNTP
jgi:putative transposase